MKKRFLVKSLAYSIQIYLRRTPQLVFSLELLTSYFDFHIKIPRRSFGDFSKNDLHFNSQMHSHRKWKDISSSLHFFYHHDLAMLCVYLTLIVQYFDILCSSCFTPSCCGVQFAYRN